MRLCEMRPEYWFDWFAYTYDPRVAGQQFEGTGPLLSHLPFDMFAAQRELLVFLLRCIEQQTDNLVEKSRDMGFSWEAALLALYFWLFRKGHKTTYTSYLDRFVDLKGNPDSFFEKIRQAQRMLPGWMMPVGWNPSKHDNSMRMINPANDNIIAGDAGDELGRGGRSTWYILDECGFMANPDRVDASTAANSRCRTFASTVNGLGNLLARKRFGGTIANCNIFRLHWTRDPRKTTDDPAWEARERGRLEPWKFASEYDIDYTSSVEGVFIPAAWVQSCVRLAELARAAGVQPSTVGVAGMDVGGGGEGKSTYVSRFGPWVLKVASRGDPDTIGTAHWGMELASADRLTRMDGWECGITCLNFDSIGIGTAVLNTFSRCDHEGIIAQGVNVGEAPTERMWTDGQTSQEKFTNLKAELWGVAREAVKCGHELYLHLTGQAGGIEHPWSDVVILPNETGDDMILQAQLSYPRRLTDEKGKVVVERKKDMLEKRGLQSPDHAEGFVLTYAQADMSDWARLGAAA
jgi:phage terminase large subunit